MNKVGFITFATNDYKEKYYKDFVQSVRVHVPFVAEIILFENPKLPKPLNTLLRYWWIDKAREQFIKDGFTHLYMIDVDTKFVNDVSVEEIIGDLVAVQHCGYVGKPNFVYPIDPRLDNGNKERYYGGGFIGGKTDTFLELCSRISHITETFLENKSIPIWDDESMLNAMLNTVMRPTKVLDPSFHYPDHPERYIKEIWGRDYTPKLILITK